MRPRSGLCRCVYLKNFSGRLTRVQSGSGDESYPRLQDLMSDRPKTFYGWWIVAICSLGLFLSTGPVVVLSFGVFLKSLIQDFHAGRATVSFAFTLHNLTGALCVPLVGRLIDRFGARRVILTGTAIFALILVSSELLGTRIAYLYLFYTGLGLVSGSASRVPYGVVASRWFDQRRGFGAWAHDAWLGPGSDHLTFNCTPAHSDVRLAYGVRDFRVRCLVDLSAGHGSLGQGRPKREGALARWGRAGARSRTRRESAGGTGLA